MKTKIFAFFMAIAMLTTSIIPAFAEEEKTDSLIDKITIEFKVGEDVLKINGTDQKVEKPYVVDGTTLVPLRVITEAFGSEVLWNDVESSVTLTYMDVVIKIWIGKKEAVVNDRNLELLQVPELTNDTTMVPLRFITENFGADVKYDDNTEKITVEKYITQSNSTVDFSQILHNTSKEYVGDSYLKWSMKYNKELALAYREFAGMYSDFVTDDGNAKVSVSVKNAKEDETLDTIFSECKEAAKDYTIIDEAKKTNSKGEEYIYMELKSTNSYIIDKTFLSDEKEYRIVAYIKNSALSEKKQTFLDIVESFNMTFDDAGKIEDLSDAKNGYRIYNNKEMKFKINIPANWNDVSNKNVSNICNFANLDQNMDTEDHENEYIGVSVISLDGKTLDQWINNDLERNKSLFNLEKYKVSGISTTKVAGNEAKFYTISKDLGDDGAWRMTDIFFKFGEYAYNIAIHISGKDAEVETNKIISSFELEELKKEDVGKLMVSSVDESMQNVKNEKMEYSFEIPSTWKYNLKQNGEYIECMDMEPPTIFSINTLVDAKNYDIGEVLDIQKKIVLDKMKNKKEITTKKYTKVGDKTGALAELTGTLGDDEMYMKIFVFNIGNKMAITMISTQNKYHGTRVDKNFENIITSFGKIEK
ncbi:MAG: copper amine oxidase N-terminal domain-containing protein [Oscillospiraceae bacterium]